MNKKVIRVFFAVCFMFSMYTTTAFAASTNLEMVPATATSKLSSNIKNKTFNHSIYINGEFALGIKCKVRAYYGGSLYYDNRITDVDVELSGPLANECSQRTEFTSPIAVSLISSKESKPIALLSFLIDAKGNIKCNIDKYVK